jgi:hypothetical protein
MHQRCISRDRRGNDMFVQSLRHYTDGCNSVIGVLYCHIHVIFATLVCYYPRVPLGYPGAIHRSAVVDCCYTPMHISWPAHMERCISLYTPAETMPKSISRRCKRLDNWYCYYIHDWGASLPITILSSTQCHFKISLPLRPHNTPLQRGST